MPFSKTISNFEIPLPHENILEVNNLAITLRRYKDSIFFKESSFEELLADADIDWENDSHETNQHIVESGLKMIQEKILLQSDIPQGWLETAPRRILEALTVDRLKESAKNYLMDLLDDSSAESVSYTLPDKSSRVCISFDERHLYIREEDKILELKTSEMIRDAAGEFVFKQIGNQSLYPVLESSTQYKVNLDPTNLYAPELLKSEISFKNEAIYNIVSDTLKTRGFLTQGHSHINLTDELLRANKIEQGIGDHQVKKDDLFKLLVSTLPVHKIYSALEKSSTNIEKKNTFKRDFLQYQLGKLTTVVLPAQKKLIPLNTLAPEQEAAKDILSIIQRLIFNTKWSVGFLGGVAVGNKEVNNVIPKGMNLILKIIDKELKLAKKNGDEPDWIKILKKVNSQASKSHQNNSIFFKRDARTSEFYNKTKTLSPKLS